MTLDEFQRIVQLVSNTTWVRTYTTSFPGQLVVEVANLDRSDLSRLRADFLDAGFHEVFANRPDAPERIRFAVARDQ